jgi:hypothetical protein
MIRRYGEKDIADMTRLMRRPGIWDAVKDDGCDRKDMGLYLYSIATVPEVWTIGRTPRHEIFLFIPMNMIHCHIHVTMSPDVKDKVQAARAAVGWMFDNSPFKAISAFIPEDALKVRHFAAMCGMQRIGKIDGSFRKNGKTVGQVIYHCTEQLYREALCQVQQQQ